MFSNHIGSVHVDYHPEKYWLATAAINKQICVYDLDKVLSTASGQDFKARDKAPSAASSQEIRAIHTLTHSESVTSIQWRPNKPLQLTACSSGIDAHLYVWDLNRPYVPYASFDNLTNKAQDFMWKANDPKILIASTEKSLWHYHINDAVRPVDNATLCTVQMDKYGMLNDLLPTSTKGEFIWCSFDPLQNISIRSNQTQ
jgi:WD40 repeat protein